MYYIVRIATERVHTAKQSKSKRSSHSQNNPSSKIRVRDIRKRRGRSCHLRRPRRHSRRRKVRAPSHRRRQRDPWGCPARGQSGGRAATRGLVRSCVRGVVKLPGHPSVARRARNWRDGDGPGVEQKAVPRLGKRVGRKVRRGQIVRQWRHRVGIRQGHEGRAAKRSWHGWRWMARRDVFARVGGREGRVGVLWAEKAGRPVAGVGRCIRRGL